MKVKNPAVAGMFYPESQVQLAQLVSQLLADNQHLRPESGVHPEVRPKAVIVPHAGLVYSGAIAALAYNRLRAYTDSIKRVVMMGPSHHVPLSSIASLSAEQWRTPLGDVQLDTKYTKELEDTGLVIQNDTAHTQEHCLEVQLPFLQNIGLDSAVVPLVVGHVDARQVAAVVEYVMDSADTLLVISSDLSHFHPYDEARSIDADTSYHIERLNPDIKPDQACGCFAMNGLLLSAKQLGLTVEKLGICNSGDTAGDKNRVVGYAAYAFC